jgi:RHS repeat-associated protein
MELLRYFYHPDHLGSSSWITDRSGQAIQHLHYLPFGEDWVDQRNTTWNTPYTFSGKEKDVETGYSYFGARYYDSGLSIWLSVDPMSDIYPSMSPYNYCANNPVILVDPDGRKIVFASGTTKEQKAQFYAAIKYLKEHDCGGRYDQLLNSNEVYTIDFTGSLYDTQYNTTTKTIKWSPNSGMKTENGFILSPATVLNHEMAHATNQDDALKKYYKEYYTLGSDKATKNYNKWIDSADEGTDPQYGNLEDKRVITGIEQRTAKKLGEIKENEITRSSHKGEDVKVKDSTSNIEVK